MKSLTKYATGCCCSADLSPQKVSFRFQRLRSSSVTPVNPKGKITRHESITQAKIQANLKWNSCIKFVMKPTMTEELSGTKTSYKEGKPFQAKPLPDSTFIDTALTDLFCSLFPQITENTRNLSSKSLYSTRHNLKLLRHLLPASISYNSIPIITRNQNTSKESEIFYLLVGSNPFKEVTPVLDTRVVSQSDYPLPELRCLLFTGASAVQHGVISWVQGLI